jgi:hypothetical protein
MVRTNWGSAIFACLFVCCVLFRRAPARGGGHDSSGGHSSSHSSSSSRGSTSSWSGSSTHVRGYTRKEGTHVEPHERSNADHNFSNNWSTKGNTNPFTGKEGTRETPPGQSGSKTHSSGISVRPGQGVGNFGPNSASTFSSQVPQNRTFIQPPSGGSPNIETAQANSRVNTDESKPTLATPARYHATLSNARSLIKHGLYGPPETYLRRIMDGARCTPIAAEAQVQLDHLLQR